MTASLASPAHASARPACLRGTAPARTYRIARKLSRPSVPREGVVARSSRDDTPHPDDAIRRVHERLSHRFSNRYREPLKDVIYDRMKAGLRFWVVFGPQHDASGGECFVG